MERYSSNQKGGRIKASSPVVIDPVSGLRMIVPPGHYKKGVKERPSELKKNSSAKNGKSPCKPGKKRGRKRIWTPEKIAEIIKMVTHGGVSAAEISRRKGINPAMISRWRKNLRES